MTKDELIEKLTSEDIPISVFGVDVDPLVVEGKLNLILKYLKEGDSRGTDVMVNGAYQEIINFISDPQAQLDALDGLIDSLDATKADNAQVQALVNQVATLNADKQNFATDKHAGNLNVGTMQEFRDYFYELRKSPTRNFQYEVSSSTNLDLMDVLGWPNGNGKEAFIYVNLPYSEAGGFEIDITYMERNGDNIYKRTMAGTLNANWKDSNWVQYAKQSNVTELASKVQTNATEIGKRIKGKGGYSPASIENTTNTFMIAVGDNMNFDVVVENDSTHKIQRIEMRNVSLAFMYLGGSYGNIWNWNSNGTFTKQRYGGDSFSISIERKGAFYGRLIKINMID